jgi:hypothetical protein
MTEVKRRPPACQRGCVSCQGVNVTGRATRGVSVARARVVRGTENRFAFEFEIHEGFGRSFGWISPGPLYTWEGDR